VHVLRAQIATPSGTRQDQAVFDQAFERATLRFRPPTAAEIATTEFLAGGMRAVAGLVQVVFLAALAIAARSRRELAALVGMFLGGQILAVVLVPLSTWAPAPRFVELAASLTVAYLAVEIILLPKAGARWLVAVALGAIHGLFFYLFLQNTGYRPALVLAGAALVEVAVVAVFGLVFARLVRAAARFQPAKVAACVLFLFGIAWFAFRLRG